MFLTENDAIKKIKQLFENHGGTFVYINHAGTEVTCSLIGNGITVDCLGDARYNEFLPLGVFWHAVHIMLINGGVATRGKAMNHRLGTEGLPFNSIEGHVASVIYGKQRDDNVLQRISPIAHILIAAGVCVEQQGDMELHDYH
jgi:hypothetical protein